MRELECDVFVAGGGTGGTAAALHAARLGHRVVISEETDWLGGQMTSQAVSALDEHPFIEQFGATQSYYELRNRIRRHYTLAHRLTPKAFEGDHFNPGNCWVTKLAFEPTVAVEAIGRMLKPLSDRLTTLYYATPIEADVRKDTIKSVVVRQQDTFVRVTAHVYLDATELGDLLALAGAEHVCGQESRAETGEPDAPENAAPHSVQSFTFPFIVELRPGENHVIQKPHDYDRLKALQQYSFNDNAIDRLFGDEWHTLWKYRRLVAAENFEDVANDICLINTKSNDYRGPSVLGTPPEEAARILDEARRASLGFLYWMQTEALRHDGGVGYPELKLRPDLTGTSDGLSKTAYYRESRRLRTKTTITEQDVVVCDGAGTMHNAGLRAKSFPESVGIGWYHLDCHRTSGGDESRFWPTRPFQVPLGALIPVRLRNLLPACKNIGVTHLSNGAYRLHPIEWAIGQAAAAVAHHALDCDVQSVSAALVQHTLLQEGAPITWYVDVPFGHPAFEAVQTLAVSGTFDSEPAWSLCFRPNDFLTAEEAATWGELSLSGERRGEAAQRLRQSA